MKPITDTALDDSGDLKESSPSGKRSYGQILKSSALIGGSSFIGVLIGLVRTKAMALMLGTTGFGLMGLYGAILELTYTIVGMGISSSGVRQIAEAAGTGEESRIARTVLVLTRTSLVLGAFGVVLLFSLAETVSLLTFESKDHTNAIRFISLAVFFTAVSRAQGALLQGMRRIADMARIGVFGALFGSVVSILFVYFFREKGIAPALVSVAGFLVLTTWWYSRKVRFPAVHLTRAETRHEVGGLLKLGVAFMASAVLTAVAAYVIRLMVAKQVSVDAAGLYQSAWAIGGMYVALILESMGADFYPRLTAIAQDNAECNRLVNEQARISLLLAGPGILATLAFAPLVVHLLYSAKFIGAVEILRWICLGMALRIIAWPMGYIVLAKGVRKIFLLSEVAAAVVHVGAAWLLIPHFGAVGGGMAFFTLYAWHGFFIYFIVRKLAGFRWSPENWRTGMLFVGLIGGVFASFSLLTDWVAFPVAIAALIFCCIYSVRVLVTLVPVDRIPVSYVRSFIRWGFRVGIIKQPYGH